MMFEYERLIVHTDTRDNWSKFVLNYSEIFMWDSNATFNTIDILSIELS